MNTMELQFIIPSVCRIIFVAFFLTDKWIDRGSVTSPAFIKWPARGLAYIKDIVSEKQRYHSEMKAAVSTAFVTTAPGWQRS